MKSLSCVQPSATPWTAAFQAPPSMGFSRQEYWSGVPLPSPILNTRQIQNSSLFSASFFYFLLITGSWMCMLAKSFQVVSDSLGPYGQQPTRLLCPWNSPGKNTGMGCHVFFQWMVPIQGSNPESLTSPALAGGFFTSSATWLMDSFGENTIISLLYSGKLGSFLKTSGSPCFLKEKTKLHRSPQWVP